MFPTTVSGSFPCLLTHGTVGGDTLEAQGEDLNALLTVQEGTGKPPEFMLAAGWVQVVPKQRP